jgi:hypothetical protein
MTLRDMNKHHRINVWRIGNCCPVCGSKRDYSPGNHNGIECYCSNDDCAYSELFSNIFIHNYAVKNDTARFEVLDHNNKVRDGWIYHPQKWELQAMKICIMQRKEERKQHKENRNKIYGNLGDLVYCREIQGTRNISQCIGCAWCEEHGFESNDMEFSKCRYPFKNICEVSK